MSSIEYQLGDVAETDVEGEGQQTAAGTPCIHTSQRGNLPRDPEAASPPHNGAARGGDEWYTYVPSSVSKRDRA